MRALRSARLFLCCLVSMTPRELDRFLVLVGRFRPPPLLGEEEELEERASVDLLRVGTGDCCCDVLHDLLLVGLEEELLRLLLLGAFQSSSSIQGVTVAGAAMDDLRLGAFFPAVGLVGESFCSKALGPMMDALLEELR